jgi:hypothetical protein
MQLDTSSLEHPLLVIGISGKKRHGKDTVAKILGDLHGVRRLAFADHLKWVAMKTWDLSFEQVYGDDLKEVVDDRWGLTPRFILQQLGTQVGRNIHTLTWVKKALDNIKRAHRGEPVLLPDLVAREFREFQFSPGEANTWAIPDCRFPGEADAIKAVKGVVVKVVRPEFSKRETDTHASETEVDNVVEDYLVINDGTVAELVVKVVALPLLGRGR